VKAHKTLAALAVAAALLATPMSAAQASGGRYVDDCFVGLDRAVRAEFVRVRGWLFHRHDRRVAHKSRHHQAMK
jgi:hypothetical protein